MTRLEELTLNLADDVLDEAEERELHALVEENEQARQLHVRILQIEAGLRAQRQHTDLPQLVIAQLRSQNADFVARGVMARIKTQPNPKWVRKQASDRDPIGSRARILLFPVNSQVWRSFQRVWLPLAACLVLLAGMGFWLFGSAMGKPVLFEIAGPNVSIQREGQLVSASLGSSLHDGDILRAGERTSVVIGFAPEQTRVTLSPGTELTLQRIWGGKQFELVAGKVEASVARQRPFRPMLLKTSRAEARVIGTRFRLTATTNSTRLDVMEGKVRFTRLIDEKFVQVTTGHYAVAAADYELSALPFTGGVTREQWIGIQGKTKVSLPDDPRFPAHPDTREPAPDFELTIAETNHLGIRLCGYIHPPTTGDYRFWLESPPTDFTSIGYAGLLMSPMENPADAVELAQTGGGGLMFAGAISSPYTSGDSKTKASPPIPLVAGRRYFFEARIVIEQGEGKLSVMWQPPGKDREVLSSKYLSPWKPK